MGLLWRRVHEISGVSSGSSSGAAAWPSTCPAASAVPPIADPVDARRGSSVRWWTAHEIGRGALPLRRRCSQRAVELLDIGRAAGMQDDQHVLGPRYGDVE